MENFLLNRDVNFVEKNMVIEYGDKKIKFCNNILQVIQKYVQSERKSCEAGGILIGRENCGNSNLIIEFIIFIYRFKQLEKNWKRNEGWHSISHYCWNSGSGYLGI